jgi:hypothetical protein
MHTDVLFILGCGCLTAVEALGFVRAERFVGEVLNANEVLSDKRLNFARDLIGRGGMDAGAMQDGAGLLVHGDPLRGRGCGWSSPHPQQKEHNTTSSD